MIFVRRRQQHGNRDNSWRDTTRIPKLYRKALNRQYCFYSHVKIQYLNFFLNKFPVHFLDTFLSSIKRDFLQVCRLSQIRRNRPKNSPKPFRWRFIRTMENGVFELTKTPIGKWIPITTSWRTTQPGNIYNILTIYNHLVA